MRRLVRAAILRALPTVWYFAYGSNMQSATLRGRRGVDYRRAVPARVHGWQLVFDKPGLIALEGQTFANLVPDATSQVLGVCFEITHDDLAHVELTEGVAIANYRRTMVAVEPLAATAGAPREAATLTSDRRATAPRPTSRYMALLIDGAREHGLPPQWITRLQAIPTVAEDAEASALRTFLDQAMRKPREPAA